MQTVTVIPVSSGQYRVIESTLPLFECGECMDAGDLFFLCASLDIEVIY